MPGSRVLLPVVFVAVVINVCFATDELWPGLHFVWGSPRIAVESTAT